MSDIQRYEMRRTLGVHPAMKHECGGWVKTNEAYAVIHRLEDTAQDHIKAIEELKAEIERLNHGWTNISDGLPDEGLDVILIYSYYNKLNMCFDRLYKGNFANTLCQGYEPICWKPRPQIPEIKQCEHNE